MTPRSMQASLRRCLGGEFLILSVVGTLLFAMTSAQAAVISMNIGGDADVLAATDVVGAVAVANWNNAAGAGSSNPATQSNVTDSTGAATTADVSFSQMLNPYVNNTGAMAAPMDDDVKMMRSHRARSNTGGQPSTTVVQIPYALYDIYVYWGGRPASESVAYTMAIELLHAGVVDATRYIRDANRTWDGTYNESTAATAAEAVDGNEYVVFRNQTATSFTLRTADNRRTAISGFQIVELVPEPATLVLTALGTLLVTVRGRGRRQSV